MSEATVRFSRTIRPREYESATAEVALTVQIEEGTDPSIAITQLMLEAKANVFSQLGIPFTVNPDGVAEEDYSAVTEVLQQFPGTAVVPVAPAPQPVPQPVPYGGPEGPPPVYQQPAAPQGACPKCSSAMWDNRADNQRKRAGGYKLSPDFKCKSCGHAIWPDDYQQYKNLPREPR